MLLVPEELLESYDVKDLAVYSTYVILNVEVLLDSTLKTGASHFA